MNMFTTFYHKNYGEVKTVSPAVKMSETPTKVSRPVPMIGEHGFEILKSLDIQMMKLKVLLKNEIMSIEKS